MKMKFIRKYNSQIIGAVLISAILYFGSFFGLRAIYLPPKIIIAGKTGTVQSGAFKGRQSNDAPIIVPFGLGERLNWICRPVNNFCRSKTGFGLYFMPPKSYGNVFIEMP